jgi:hypothetical protein
MKKAMWGHGQYNELPTTKTNKLNADNPHYGGGAD